MVPFLVWVGVAGVRPWTPSTPSSAA